MTSQLTRRSVLCRSAAAASTLMLPSSLLVERVAARAPAYAFAEELPLVSSNSVPLKSSVDDQGRPGFAPNPQLMPWERAIALGRERKAVVMAMFKTPDRQSLFDFSVPVMDDTIVVVTRRGHEFPLNSPDDLIGRRCAVQQGAQYGSHYAAIAHRIEKDTDNNAGNRLRKLLLRQFDCALFNPGTESVRQTIRSQGLNADDFTILPTPLARVPSYMAIGKGDDVANQAMLRRLNRSITALRADGTIDRIMRGYMHDPA